ARRRPPDAHDRGLLPVRPARRLRDGGRAGRGRLCHGDGRGARLSQAAHAPDATIARMTRLIARAAVLAAAAFVVLGPLVSLGVWSLAERWTAPSPWPQRFGLK